MSKSATDTVPLAYSIPEAVRVSNLGKSTLYDEMAAGNLKAIKMGRRTLILREDLLAFLSRLPARQPQARAA